MLSVLLGVVLGFWTGLAVALAGGLLGGLAAFGLSRALGRDAVTRLAGPRVTAVDRALGERGFGAVLAGRLLPVVPFSVLSHAAGLSVVSPGPYVAATALGLVPSTVLQVGVGASVPGLTAWAAGACALVAGGAAVVVGSLHLSWRPNRVRRALDDQFVHEVKDGGPLPRTPASVTSAEACCRGGPAARWPGPPSQRRRLCLGVATSQVVHAASRLIGG